MSATGICFIVVASLFGATLGSGASFRADPARHLARALSADGALAFDSACRRRNAWVTR